MSGPSRPRARLQRAEKDGIKKVMSNVRINGKKLVIRDTADYVWGYQGDEPVIGFRWVPKQGWRVYLTFLIHCHADLEAVAHEIRRVNSCTTAMDKAWNKYKNSRSDKNWAHYQGCIAALFMGEEIV